MSLFILASGKISVLSKSTKLNKARQGEPLVISLYKNSRFADRNGK